MKIIFTQDVKGVGQRDEVREVAHGYALNYLLPQGLAVRATAVAVAAVSQRRAKSEQRISAAVAAARQLQARLNGQTVAVRARAAESGKLYAAVSAAAISQAIRSTFGVILGAGQVVCADSIKSVGSHMVTLQLNPEVAVTMTVKVVAIP